MSLLYQLGCQIIMSKDLAEFMEQILTAPYCVYCASHVILFGTRTPSAI